MFIKEVTCRGINRSSIHLELGPPSCTTPLFIFPAGASPFSRCLIDRPPSSRTILLLFRGCNCTSCVALGAQHRNIHSDLVSCCSHPQPECSVSYPVKFTMWLCEAWMAGANIASLGFVHDLTTISLSTRVQQFCSRTISPVSIHWHVVGMHRIICCAVLCFLPCIWLCSAVLLSLAVLSPSWQTSADLVCRGVMGYQRAATILFFLLLADRSNSAVF